VLEHSAITISMDGKGRCMDNIFVERLWRSLKYEEIYLNAYGSVAEAKAGIAAWLSFYNDERQHQSLGYRTPRQIYQEGLWICGRSALPTGSASPTSRANSESGEMLAFAHIPTGATANIGCPLSPRTWRRNVRARPEITESTFDRVRYGFTTCLGYHML